MTPGDIIRLALKTAGVISIGQTADAEDTFDLLTVTNSMLAQWSRKKFLIYRLVDVAFRSTGAQSYTVGPGGQFNCPRPDQLETAYVRLLSGINPLDYPLDVIEAREDYAAISFKSLTSIASSIFYDPTIPLGTVYPYPVPSSQYELHLVLKETLTQFADLVTQITLPPEYLDALIWNVAVRARALWNMPPDPHVIGMAATALNVIRGANTSIPRLTMPDGVPGIGGGRWAGHNMVSGGGGFILDSGRL